MPKCYTDKERKIIKDELLKVAFESLMHNGVKRTTVDDIVEKVHIPKGTFYLFYPSKEMVLYDALMQKEEEIHNKLNEGIKEIKDNYSIERLIDLIYDFFILAFDIGILPLMVNGEMDILIRKLPDEIVMKHIQKDDDFLLIFQEIFKNISKEKLNDYSACFRAIFFTATYKREIGTNYDNVLKILIKGILKQMMEEEND